VGDRFGAVGPLRRALSEYLSRYLERERLLAQNPCTNGPATPTNIEIEFP
jgi:hypothetical protein